MGWLRRVGLQLVPKVVSILQYTLLEPLHHSTSHRQSLQTSVTHIFSAKGSINLFWWYFRAMDKNLFCLGLLQLQQVINIKSLLIVPIQSKAGRDLRPISSRVHRNKRTKTKVEKALPSLYGKKKWVNFCSGITELYIIWSAQVASTVVPVYAWGEARLLPAQLPTYNSFHQHWVHIL